jgi:hypothetical protein
MPIPKHDVHTELIKNPSFGSKVIMEKGNMTHRQIPGYHNPTFA